jgi:hypothetical protein
MPTVEMKLLFKNVLSLKRMSRHVLPVLLSPNSMICKRAPPTQHANQPNTIAHRPRPWPAGQSAITNHNSAAYFLPTRHLKTKLLLLRRRL